ncbi:MAG: septal ring lytic transglycosylase RlpA family protein [Parvularculaceae bacterium]
MSRLSWTPFAAAVFAALAGCASAPDASIGGAPAPRAAAPKTATKPHAKIGEPYVIAGRRYAPKRDDAYDAIGGASWYGKRFDGRPTANGETFDRRLFSAAHKTMPLPSIALVENVENGRQVAVRVNDRGPFVDGRIIDLSEAAAEALGFRAQGVAKVRVRYGGRANAPARAPRGGAALPATRRAVAALKAPAAPDRVARAAPPPPVSAEALYWVETARTTARADAEGALAQFGGFRAAAVNATPIHDYEEEEGAFAVRLGPFERLADADEAMAVAAARGFADAIVLRAIVEDR